MEWDKESVSGWPHSGGRQLFNNESQMEVFFEEALGCVRVRFSVGREGVFVYALV